MKASTHLFYGIIIGVLATLCMGLNKEEEKGYEQIIVRTFQDGRLHEGINKWKKDGWKILDMEVTESPNRTTSLYYFLLAK